MTLIKKLTYLAVPDTALQMIHRFDIEIALFVTQLRTGESAAESEVARG